MPLHVYHCPRCEEKFTRHRQWGETVGFAEHECGQICHKSWDPEDIETDVIDDGQEYFDEQLGKVVTRSTLKRAMKEVELESDGKVKPEWY